MQMRTMVSALAAGLVLTTATIFASAGHGGPKGDRGPGDGPFDGKGPFAALDLTDAQKEQIKTLHEQFRASHESQFEQMKTLHDRIRSQKEAGDEEGAKATRLQIRELHDALHADREALHTQIDALLTDAQKAKLQEMRARHEHRGKRKGMCRGDKDKGDEAGDAGAGTQNGSPAID